MQMFAENLESIQNTMQQAVLVSVIVKSISILSLRYYVCVTTSATFSLDVYQLPAFSMKVNAKVKG